VPQDQQNHRKHQRQAKKQGNGVAGKAPGTPPISGAHRLADANGGTHRQPQQHNGEHVHHLGANGHGGGIGHRAKTADNQQICHTV